jgi:hypothetical protein
LRLQKTALIRRCCDDVSAVERIFSSKAGLAAGVDNGLYYGIIFPRSRFSLNTNNHIAESLTSHENTAEDKSYI